MRIVITTKDGKHLVYDATSYNMDLVIGFLKMNVTHFHDDELISHTWSETIYVAIDDIKEVRFQDK